MKAKCSSGTEAETGLLGLVGFLVVRGVLRKRLKWHYVMVT